MHQNLLLRIFRLDRLQGSSLIKGLSRRLELSEFHGIPSKTPSFPPNLKVTGRKKMPASLRDHPEEKLKYMIDVLVLSKMIKKIV